MYGYHKESKEYHRISIESHDYSATLCALGPGPEMGRWRELRPTRPGSTRRLRGEYAESLPIFFEPGAIGSGRHTLNISRPMEYLWNVMAYLRNIIEYLRNIMEYLWNIKEYLHL